jgi:hypothetical protein
MRKIDKNLYRYTAEAIRRYPFDVNRLEVLREYLAARDGSDLGVCARDGGRLAPQETAFDRMWNSGEYRRLIARVTVMEHLLGLLTNEEERLLELVLDELSWPQIGTVMNLAEETCKKRKWPKIVMKAARLYFGDLV